VKTTLPPSLVRYRDELEEAGRRDLAAAGSRGRRRFRVRTGVAGAIALAAVAAAVVLVTSRDDAVVQPASADVLRGASAALNPAPGSILQVAFSATQDNGDGTTVRWRQESWEQVGPPYDDRQVNQLLPGTPAGVEAANRAGLPEIYDPRTNIIYVGPRGVADSSRSSHDYRLSAGPRPGTYRLSVPGSNLRSIVISAAQARRLRAHKLDLAFTMGSSGHPVRLGLVKARVIKPRHTEPTVTADPFSPQFRSQIKRLIDSGYLRVVGPVVVHGRQAIEIASADRHLVYDVAPNTYRPVEFDTRGTSGGVDMFISTYRVLPGRGNGALLSLRAQHPDATVDRSVADYNMALHRLFPHG
jgi:hypothetical protein